jgi:WhiB family redox-sensing transcriptional regulator
MSTWREDWRERAACLGEDPELFFPIGTGPRAERQIAEAKQVCARCPVLRQCRAFALDYAYEGVWGGTEDTERRTLRRLRSLVSMSGLDSAATPPVQLAVSAAALRTTENALRTSENLHTAEKEPSDS